MKKAKLMLSALGICAVLASAFAFNTSKFATHFVYTGTFNSGVCNVKQEGRQIDPLGTANIAASTTSLDSGCPNAATIRVDD